MSDRLPLSRRVSPQAVLGWLGTAVVVVAVYVVVVLGGGLLLDAPSAQLLLSVLATVVVAATIDGVQQRCERLAARLLHGGRQSPYEVLTRFSPRAVEADALGRLPEQMARLLAEGTATAWAQVWLLVNGRPTLMATHPPDAGALTDPPSTKPLPPVGSPSRWSIRQYSVENTHDHWSGRRSSGRCAARCVRTSIARA